MAKHIKPEPLPESQVSRAIRAAIREGDERRREYLASLDPRQREQLAMGDPP
jgi:hypothetical protein